MFSTFISQAQDRLAKRKRYNRLVAEIESLSARDLVDIRADRSELLHHAWKQVYGK